MQTEVQFAGFGGQGILSSAKLLAYTAMKQDFFVAWVPSYGPEMRGGTAYCTVVISDRRIGSPVIKTPTHLVAMNRPSLEKFSPCVKAGGVIFINSSLIPTRSQRTDITEMVIPVNDAAIRLGSVKCANIIALSAFASKINLIDMDLLRQCVIAEFQERPKLLDLNANAFDEGIKLASA